MSWRSSLEVWDVATGQSRVILRTPMLIEAPNWHPDGWFLVNGEGRLWRADADGLQLLPRNPAYAPIRVPAGADFAIEGLFCGLVRQG